ncbi:MAG TPA: FAD-binding oxidoreductase [Candidatus Binatia bacterium]|jgi:glycolate oxidase FAD binding subunit|nr:FAD-binding oxidoreductase [Candidatus Binatia bacterium]
MTTAWSDVVGAEFARPGRWEDAVDGVVPAWVLRPGTVAEVQAIVREGPALVASGLGAHLDRGAPPRRFDVLVRLDRLGRIVDHQAADMTVTVEAGCSLATVQATLAAAGQWLPIDPPRPEATTVGGMLAADLSGPLRASQGTARDLVIGLRVVGGDGALVSSGGKVVKNVAGYDLSKLHLGALGSVGVIVEATFRVRPRPEREEAVVVPCARPADLALVVRDAVEPMWLEVAGAGVLDGGPALVVGLAGIAAEVEHAAARVADVASGGHRLSDGAAMRAHLAGFDAEPAAALLTASALPADTGAVMDAVADAARTTGAGVRMLAHAANGVVRVAVADAAPVGSLVALLRPQLAGMGGTVVVARASAAAKAGVDVWGEVGPGLSLMRALKTTFDPRDILSPGRFVGGM